MMREVRLRRASDLIALLASSVSDLLLDKNCNCLVSPPSPLRSIQKSYPSLFLYLNRRCILFSSRPSQFQTRINIKKKKRFKIFFFIIHTFLIFTFICWRGLGGWRGSRHDVSKEIVFVPEGLFVCSSYFIFKAALFLKVFFSKTSCESS